MTAPTHIAMGAVIGTIFGHPILAIAVSVLIDIDHLYSYVRHGVIWQPQKLWKTLTDSDDPYGDQRGYLHNIIIAVILCGLSFLVVPVSFALVFSVSYIAHLVLDALDRSDYFIFFPSTKVNIKGFIDYYGKTEIIFIVFLLLLALALKYFI